MTLTRPTGVAVRTEIERLDKADKVVVLFDTEGYKSIVAQFAVDNALMKVM